MRDSCLSPALTDSSLLRMIDLEPLEDIIFVLKAIEMA